MGAASAVALLAACGGGGTGPSQGVGRADLLALPDTASAAAGDVSCTFKNNVLSHCQITHSDAAHTPFATFTFPPHSIVSRNDTLLADTSTVVLTVAVTPGLYGFTLEPSTLVFNQTSEPTVDVSFAIYGDASVYTQSARYASASAFVQALGLWRERATDRWVLGRNSALTGTTVSSALEGVGSYLLAAPK